MIFFLMFGCKIKIMGKINREERIKRRSMQGGGGIERKETHEMHARHLSPYKHTRRLRPN